MCFLFLLGPVPFFVASLFCFVAKRKSGWGICGSFLVVVVLLFFVCRWFRDDLPKFLDHTCPCTLLLFTAYAIVRTEPSANRPNRRKKKAVYYLSIATKVLVVDLYAVQRAVLAGNKQTKNTTRNKGNQTNKKKHNHNQTKTNKTQRSGIATSNGNSCMMTSCVSL